jgi:predicted dienelactone hydrolase
MKRFLLCLAILMPFHTAAADEVPGLVTREILAPHHGRQMEMAIWYPAREGKTGVFAENPIFRGGDVRRDAPPLEGRYPIILLSHGMGGTYLSLNWLASGLSARGAVVVSVNHPNGWFRDRQPDKMFNHWTRVQDLQVALDSVLADKAFAKVIDPSRIYAAGFSFGGWTALSLGGVTANPDGNIAYCQAAGERSHNCTDLKTFGLDPAKIDHARWTASYKDARIKAVAAIEPGLTWKLDASNVRDLEQDKLLIIGLGRGTDRHYATDTTERGSGFESLVPDAKVEILAPATHFTAMPLCTPAGADILAAEKDDPVCTDPPGTDREAVHTRIIELLAQHFGL